jgi:hypothetical protein
VFPSIKFVNFLCPNFAISKVAKRSSKYLHTGDAAFISLSRFIKTGGVFPTLSKQIS